MAGAGAPPYGDPVQRDRHEQDDADHDQLPERGHAGDHEPGLEDDREAGTPERADYRYVAAFQEGSADDGGGDGVKGVVRVPGQAG